MSGHCGNLERDRAIGGYWERQFCRLASRHGRSFTAHQIGREKSAVAWVRSGGEWNQWTLPDITLWTRPGEHHEIKHKDPCAWGFGLERYRLEALRAFWEETGTSVYYTIHDYSRQPGGAREDRKQNQSNVASHWVSAPVSELMQEDPLEKWGFSYVGGVKKRVPICYWPISIFQPVTWLWRHEVARDANARLISVQPTQ